MCLFVLFCFFHSGTLKSFGQACTASSLPTEPSPHPCLQYKVYCLLSLGKCVWFVFVRMGAHTCTHGGQRATVSVFPPWDPGIKLRLSSGLHSKHTFLLNRLTGPVCIFYVLISQTILWPSTRGRTWFLEYYGSKSVILRFRIYWNHLESLLKLPPTGLHCQSLLGGV